MNRSTEVLIAGAGPVGLAVAIELASRNVDVMVVQQSEEPSRQSRAKLVNVRSVTSLRRWRIVDAVKSAAPLGTDSLGDIAFLTDLVGLKSLDCRVR